MYNFLCIEASNGWLFVVDTSLERMEVDRVHINSHERVVGKRSLAST